MDEELAKEMHAAFASERARTPLLDETARQRVLAKLALSIAPAAAAAGAIGLSQTLPAKLGFRLASKASAKVLAVALASFVAGGATHAMYATRSAPTNVMQVSSAMPTGTALPVTSSAIVESPPGIDVNALPTAAPTLSSSPIASGDLQVRERTLLETAQVALSRGNSGEALRLAEKHANTFPRSSLGEERDALRIRALANLGRCVEVVRALGHFREQFPHSMHIHALGQLCGKEEQ